MYNKDIIHHYNILPNIFTALKSPLCSTCSSLPTLTTGNHWFIYLCIFTISIVFFPECLAVGLIYYVALRMETPSISELLFQTSLFPSLLCYQNLDWEARDCFLVTELMSLFLPGSSVLPWGSWLWKHLCFGFWSLSVEVTCEASAVIKATSLWGPFLGLVQAPAPGGKLQMVLLFLDPGMLSMNEPVTWQSQFSLQSMFLTPSFPLLFYQNVPLWDWDEMTQS